MTRLKGLTWKHIRAIDSLRISALLYEKEHNVAIDWQIRDLSQFEHQPMSEIIEEYDMIVYDHPFSGVVWANNYFEDLGELAQNESLTRELYIGQSFDSYLYKGTLCGLPIDAASNHAVYRKDILERIGGTVPKCWEDVNTLGVLAKKSDVKLALALKGHHGLLIVAALCANLNKPWSTSIDKEFYIDELALAQSIQSVSEILEYSHKNSVDWNAIDLHNAMSYDDTIVYSPVVYGYSTYGEDYLYPKRLSFANFPGIKSPYCAGSVLGGTAIGLSTVSRYKGEAKKYMAWLSNSEIQSKLLAQFHGQPPRKEVWQDNTIDKKYNGFYSTIRATMESAWVRPRFKGYQQFEQKSGRELEKYFRGEISERKTVQKILEYAKSEFISW